MRKMDYGSVSVNAIRQLCRYEPLYVARVPAFRAHDRATRDSRFDTSDIAERARIRRMRPLLIAALVLQVTTTRAQKLTDQQINEAIELGRKGSVPIVQVGTVLGGLVSKGDFRVFIEGPVARIAAAASQAFKEYRPFNLKTVTNDMKAPVYRVSVERMPRNGAQAGAVVHIVLQPRRAKGMDGVVQPIKETPPGAAEAHFDHFPDGEFDVVVVTETGPQKYSVDSKLRAKIR